MRVHRTLVSMGIANYRIAFRDERFFAAIDSNLSKAKIAPSEATLSAEPTWTADPTQVG